MKEKPNKEIATILPRQRIVYSVILSIALVWCAGILIAPLWADTTDFRGSVSAFLYTFFSKNCHQLDDRSLHLWGHKLGVCSRCTMVYFGFLATTLLYPFIRKLNNFELPALWILLAGTSLVLIDAGLDIFDVVSNTFMSREITGGILGLILPFYLIPGSIRLLEEFFTPSDSLRGAKQGSNPVVKDKTQM